MTVTFSHEPVMKARDDLKKTDCHIMAVGAPRQRFVPSIGNIEKAVFSTVWADRVIFGITDSFSIKLKYAAFKGGFSLFFHGQFFFQYFFT